MPRLQEGWEDGCAHPGQRPVPLSTSDKAAKGSGGSVCSSTAATTASPPSPAATTASKFVKFRSSGPVPWTEFRGLVVVRVSLSCPQQEEGWEETFLISANLENSRSLSFLKQKTTSHFFVLHFRWKKTRTRVADDDNDEPWVRLILKRPNWHELMLLPPLAETRWQCYQPT